MATVPVLVAAVAIAAAASGAPWPRSWRRSACWRSPLVVDLFLGRRVRAWAYAERDDDLLVRRGRDDQAAVGRPLRAHAVRGRDRRAGRAVVRAGHRADAHRGGRFRRPGSRACRPPRRPACATTSPLSGRPGPRACDRPDRARRWRAPLRAAAASRGWRRLHPLSPLVRAGGPLGGLLVLAITGARRHGNYTAVLFEVGVIALLVLLGFVSWLVTRWRIEDGVLRIESGLLRRTSRRFPADQIQAVDTVRPVVARMFGLAEVRVRMAASTGQSGPALLPRRQRGRARSGPGLLALAHGVAEHAPPPPEQVLITTPTARLVPSILLSGIGLVLEAVIVGLVILVVLTPSAVGPALSVTATALIGLVRQRVPPAQQRLPPDRGRGARWPPAAVRSASDRGRDDPPRPGAGGPDDRAAALAAVRLVPAGGRRGR